VSKLLRPEITGQVLLQRLVPVLVLVLVVLLRLEVQEHQQRLELRLRELLLVRLFHMRHWHNRCLLRMLNRSCCHMLSHRQVLLRSRLELEHSMMELVRSRLALACSTLRGLACTSELCT
jgi:hypothetical protein